MAKGHLARGEVEDAEFGVEHQTAELGDEEQFAIGYVKSLTAKAQVFGKAKTPMISADHSKVNAATAPMNR